MINQLLKNYINTRPDDVFIYYNSKKITYDDMAYAVEGRIKSMQAINIQKGNIVGIYLENPLDLLEILFGCIEIEAHPLIIPSNSTALEIKNLNKDIQRNLII